MTTPVAKSNFRNGNDSLLNYGCDRKWGSTTPQLFDVRKPFGQPPIL